MSKMEQEMGVGGEEGTVSGTKRKRKMMTKTCSPAEKSRGAT